MNGNAATQFQNVIINDITAPTPDSVTLADIIAQCSLFEADIVTPTATDNCLGVVTVTNDGIYPIMGSTTITWTYTDANGNSVIQPQNVVINDTTPPTPDATILADITAQCEVLATDVIAPTATDNCVGLVTVTNDAVFPITASTTITWTYADANGNNSLQTQNVIVNDTTAPTPDAVTLADVTAQCEVLEVDVLAPTATDNCSSVTVTNNTVFPITASTLITWTYTDVNGNTATQFQNVVINDNTAPIPDADLLADVSAQCQVLEADVTIPTATDNCSGVTVTNNVTFPINTSTTITWTFTDANGNSTIQIQNVFINDATAPTPDAVSLSDVNAPCQVLQTDVTVPTATDNCSAVTVTSDGLFPITASTVITWIYTDANGNTASQTQNIVINDNTAPTPDAVTLADINAQCALLEANLVVPTATDNCSVVTVTNDGVFPITSPTTITWTYTDVNGNTATQTQNVVITNDTTAPIPDAPTLIDITAQCQVLQSDVNVPTATDNCSAVTVTNDATFPITAQGVSTITWTFADANGNISTQTQDVLIGDNTAPTVTLSDITVSVNVLGTVTVTVDQLENGTANDNCGIASITVTPNTFSCTDLGSHAVAVTVTDVNGNSTVQSATVTVTDPTDFCTALGLAHNENSIFAIYPNPTSDMIYVKANNKAVYAVKLYALSGQLVLQKSYNQNAERYSVSLASLPQGTYLLKLETAEGTSTKRVIKY